MADFSGNQINFAELEIAQVVGKGAFGIIYKAVWKGQVVAAKKLLIEGDKLAAFSEFRREVWLMHGLHHPCIVNLKGYPLSLSPFPLFFSFIHISPLHPYLSPSSFPSSISLPSIRICLPLLSLHLYISPSFSLHPYLSPSSFSSSISLSPFFSPFPFPLLFPSTPISFLLFLRSLDSFPP